MCFLGNFPFVEGFSIFKRSEEVEDETLLGNFRFVEGLPVEKKEEREDFSLAEGFGTRKGSLVRGIWEALGGFFVKREERVVGLGAELDDSEEKLL